MYTFTGSSDDRYSWIHICERVTLVLDAMAPPPLEGAGLLSALMELNLIFRDGTFNSTLLDGGATDETEEEEEEEVEEEAAVTAVGAIWEEIWEEICEEIEGKREVGIRRVSSVGDCRESESDSNSLALAMPRSFKT